MVLFNNHANQHIRFDCYQVTDKTNASLRTIMSIGKNGMKLKIYNDPLTFHVRTCK